ncbi:MAG: MFS transporter [Winkia neuii]|uniref:MFS transporter n=1 Tax=Winkia neuii TaxID=33007 RepID=UPI0004258CCA|nr:MFS transporter [Winkia neuii]MDK8099956.1 MFS transporter [Winkia neuii]MDU3134967.1 MFS transporter [Winkia neuii]OFK04395.1 hypothetical protein HMPREF2835_04010 [Actinomyces sp. HMSC072A03]OFT56355.1 hypothetical protein HMPREF3152_02245 [Actinomyces sp. HMSC06A08]
MSKQENFPAQRIFAAVAIATLTVIALSTMATTAIAPRIGRELHGIGLFPLIFGLSGALQVIFTVLAGVWVDAKGARPALLAGSGFLVASLLGAAFAPTISVFLIARALDGIANGLVLVPLYVLAAQLVPPSSRADIFALFSAAWVLPSLVGPAFGGYISQLWGWRTMFVLLILALVPVAAGALVLFKFIPTQNHRVNPRDRRRSGWALVAGLAVLALQLASTLEVRLRPWAMIVGLIAAGIGISKILPEGILRARPSIPAWVGARGMFNGAFITLEVFIPLILQNVRGYSTGISGLALALGSGTWAAGSFLGGRPFAAPYLRKLPVGGSVVLAVGIALSATAAFPGVPIIIFLAGWAVAGIGMGMAYAPLSVLVLDTCAPAEQGLQSANIQVSDSLGMALVMGIVASLFQLFLHSPDPGPYLAPLAVAFVVSLFAGFYAFRGQRHSRRP